MIYTLGLLVSLLSYVVPITLSPISTPTQNTSLRSGNLQYSSAKFSQFNQWTVTTVFDTPFKEYQRLFVILGINGIQNYKNNRNLQLQLQVDKSYQYGFSSHIKDYHQAEKSIVEVSYIAMSSLFMDQNRILYLFQHTYSNGENKSNYALIQQSKPQFKLFTQNKQKQSLRILSFLNSFSISNITNNLNLTIEYKVEQSKISFQLLSSHLINKLKYSNIVMCTNKENKLFQYGQISIQKLLFDREVLQIKHKLIGQQFHKIVGLKSLSNIHKIQHRPQLMISFSLVNDQLSNNMKNSILSYLIIRDRKCPQANPYYLRQSRQCLNSCPAGYVANIQQSTCTESVQAMVSHIPSSRQHIRLLFKMVAVSCSVSNCLSCPNFTTVCQSCDVGYYLSANNTLCVSQCGDGNTTADQQCDDNNTVDGDGCNADCTMGNWWGCPANQPYILYVAASGSGGGSRLLLAQATATGSRASRLLQNNTCYGSCPPGYYTNASGFLCLPIVCGDTLLVPPQQCDDGDTVDGDGCNADCTIGNWWGCPASAPYVIYINDRRRLLNQIGIDKVRRLLQGGCLVSCPAGHYTDAPNYKCLPIICGDWQIVPPQECEDGNTVDGDGCNADCTMGNNNGCPASTPFIINNNPNGGGGGGGMSRRLLQNNNKIVGRLMEVDPCMASCPPGYYTNMIDYWCQILICGDGLPIGPEQCDDNNTIDGDGCNADCTWGNWMGCPASSPYVVQDGTIGGRLLQSSYPCLSQCPPRYFTDIYSYLCFACPYTCSQCNVSDYQCSACSLSDNRYLSNSSCLPLPGYYENQMSVAQPCPTPCQLCSNSISCISCIPGFYLVAPNYTQCLSCNDSVPECTGCYADPNTTTAVICTNCSLGFMLNASNSCEEIICNNLTNCQACYYSPDVCDVCDTGFLLRSGQCIQIVQIICGDAILVPNSKEQCDDGNTNDGDGCSATCTIQQYYVCQVVNLASKCYYNGQVLIQQKYIIKVVDKNEVNIKFSLQPNGLKIWGTVDFKQMIYLPPNPLIAGYDIIRVADGFVVNIKYNGDIQDQPVNILVDPSKTNIPQLSRLASVTIMPIVRPDDNSSAYFYDQGTYKLASTIAKFASAIGILALAFYFIAIVGYKMVGIQMMAVLQISFLSLMMINHMNPCFQALSGLWLVNGYNRIGYSNYLEDAITPIPPKGIYFYSRFLQNYNFTLLLVVLPYIVAFIAWLLKRKTNKDIQPQKHKLLQKIQQRSIGEYVLNGILFSGYVISVSFIMQLKYGVKNMEGFVGIVSVFQSISLFLFMCLYFALQILRPLWFGQFTEQFKRDNISKNYYKAMMVQRFIIGLALVLLINAKFQGIFFIIFYLLLGTCIMVRKPYLKKYHNIRSATNMAIVVIIEIIYLYYGTLSQEAKNKSSSAIYLPLIVCILLIICVIYNAISLVYQILRKIKTYLANNNSKQINEIQMDQLDQIKNISKQIKTEITERRNLTSRIHTARGANEQGDGSFVKKPVQTPRELKDLLIIQNNIKEQNSIQNNNQIAKYDSL